jgi:protein-disulfide isomerase
MTPMPKDDQITWLVEPVSDHDHIQGHVGAPVTLVEYADYECPHSAQAHQIVKQLQELWGEKLCFVYRNFPKADEHPHAELAAEAAEEAGAEGIFWDMHDMLFEHQQALDTHDLLGYARTLELNPVRFAHNLAEHAHHDRIAHDLESGRESGVMETPTFFINGRRFRGDTTDFKALETALEAAAR